MRRIKLGGKYGNYALVDDEDFERVNQFVWTSTIIRYAVHNFRVAGRYERVYLHRFIMNPRKSYVIDHLNGDKLDNRKENMRVCKQKANARHKTIMNTNNTSGFTGVGMDKRQPGRPYTATIVINKKGIYLGGFHTALEAAKRYNEAAKKYFGELAFQNKVEG